MVPNRLVFDFEEQEHQEKLIVNIKPYQKFLRHLVYFENRTEMDVF